jgi:hypothetical protein
MVLVGLDSRVFLPYIAKRRTDMREAAEFLRFKIRWWRWFLFPPNPTVMELSGFDEYTRDVLRERWRKDEPIR